MSVQTVELDTYVLDALMPDLVGHDRAPSVLIVYLLLWRHTRGVGKSRVQLSLGDMASWTGLSKRAVQGALLRLKKRRLVTIERESITAVPVYAVRRPWAARAGAREEGG